MSNHTPGPWTAHGRVIRASGRYIGKAQHFHLPEELATSDPQATERLEKANACVMAAGPELLEVCKLFNDALTAGNLIVRPSLLPEYLTHFAMMITKAQVAIAKAEAQ